MKSIVVIAILISLNASAGAVNRLPVVKDITKAVLFYEWDQRGNCYAFNQLEKPIGKIKNKDVCRRSNPTYYDYARGTKDCYEFTNRGAVVQKMEDASHCVD